MIFILIILFIFFSVLMVVCLTIIFTEIMSDGLEAIKSISYNFIALLAFFVMLMIPVLNVEELFYRGYYMTYEDVEFNHYRFCGVKLKRNILLDVDKTVTKKFFLGECVSKKVVKEVNEWENKMIKILTKSR